MPSKPKIKKNQELDRPELLLLPKILGERIRNRRLELGYSLAQVSKLSQVSRGMLGLIESGKSTASIYIFWKLSMVLRSSLSDLLPEPSQHKVRIFRKGNQTAQKTGKWEIRNLVPETEPYSALEVAIPSGKWPRPDFSQETTKQTLLIQSGSIQCKLEGEWIDFSEGDSVFFLGQHLEEIKNPNKEPVVLLWTSLPNPKNQ